MCAMPVVACLVLSLENVNFLFVAVMLFFLVLTLLLYMVMIYYGLVPESRFSTLPCEINMGETEITLRVKKIRVNEEEQESEYTTETITLPWTVIKSVKAKDECLLLLLKRPEYSFIAIPYAAFTDEEHLRDTVTLVRSCI